MIPYKLVQVSWSTEVDSAPELELEGFLIDFPSGSTKGIIQNELG